MAWICLIIAGCFEVAWAVGLKYTEGFTRFWPSVLTVAGMIASFVFLAQAIKTIPLGTGYAIWTGIGGAGRAAFGFWLFSVSASPARLVSIGLIVAGIILLRVTSH